MARLEQWRDERTRNSYLRLLVNDDELDLADIEDRALLFDAVFLLEQAVAGLRGERPTGPLVLPRTGIPVTSRAERSGDEPALGVGGTGDGQGTTGPEGGS